MQIHELNNYSGSIGDAYLAADNGSDTGKMKTTALTDPLNARIDNIIAGPAPSAAEIVDARLGADEVTYPSLGAAIRDQVTDLKSDIGDLKDITTTESINIVDKTVVDYKYSINSSNTVGDVKGYRVIPIKPTNKNIAFKIFDNQYSNKIAELKIVGFDSDIRIGAVGIDKGIATTRYGGVGLYQYNAKTVVLGICIVFNISELNDIEVDSVTDKWILAIKKHLMVFETPKSYEDINWDMIEYVPHTIAQNELFFDKERKVMLGENLITGAHTATGWNGNISTGISHATGSTAPLSFDAVTSSGSAYLFEFNTTYSSNEFCKVGIGNIPKCVVYNGTGHISVILYSDGGTLAIEPYNDFSGTLSNFSLKKIQSSGEEKTLLYNNVLTKEHEYTYGFWNVLLGENAPVGYGITRTIAIGYNALKNVKSGNRNIAIGTFSMGDAEYGEGNVSIGADSMEFVKTAEKSIAIGKASMGLGTHERDIAIGEEALQCNANSSTRFNIAIGYQAGYRNENDENVFIGKQAGYHNRGGFCNVAIGSQAMLAKKSGNFNVAIGNGSAVSDACNNSTAIGNGASANKSNQVVIGNSAVEEVVFCGNKKIIFNADGSVTWEAI